MHVCSIQALTSLALSSLVKPPTPGRLWEGCQSSDKASAYTASHAFCSPQLPLNNLHFRSAKHSRKRTLASTAALPDRTALCMLGQHRSMTPQLNQHTSTTVPVKSEQQIYKLQHPTPLLHSSRVPFRLRSAFCPKQQHHQSLHRTSGTAHALTASAQQPITAVPRLQTGNEHLDGKLKIIGAACHHTSCAHTLPQQACIAGVDLYLNTQTRNNSLHVCAKLLSKLHQ